jgi:hypothetical protein
MVLDAAGVEPFELGIGLTGLRIGVCPEIDTHRLRSRTDGRSQCDGCNERRDQPDEITELCAGCERLAARRVERLAGGGEASRSRAKVV